MNTISDAIVHALGWTLAHSFWQGAIIAIGLLILLPRLQTARQKYWTAYGALIAVFAAAAATFIWVYEPRINVATGINSALEAPLSTGFLLENQWLKSSLSEVFAQWLEANHSLIVAVWLIGFVFFLLRLGGGLWQVHRLRTCGLNLPEEDWQEKLIALKTRMGITRKIDLLESIWVSTPITLGWLKPVILLPLGFVNQLSPAEVEAVLAHELAHIARRDWFFNLLQAFVESLFYYQPAVWWISQIIRRERENACDDVALAATGNPLAFARALVQVQEMAAPLPTLALAMSGKRRRPLLDRVRRILNQAPQQQHQVMEKITATVILLVLLALVGLRANSIPSIEAAFAQIADIPGAIFNDSGDENQILSDSLPKPKNTRKITREDENGSVEAEYKDGKLQRLNIDGKDIPASEFEQHEALVEELETSIPTPPDAPAPPTFWGGSEGRGANMPPPPPFPGTEGAKSYWFRSLDFPSPPTPPYPPTPPSPPHSSGGVTIVTDKDNEGNTIIKLDNNGNSTDVVVKDGELWIDGKKLEKGEEFLIPGLHFGQNGAYFFSEGSEGHGEGHGFGHGGGHGESGYYWTESEAPNRFPLEQRAQINKEMESARMEQDKAMEEIRRSLDYVRKGNEKDWKKSQKEWEKEQKAWQKEQLKWERQQKVWQEGQEKWQAKQQAMQAKNLATQELLKKELLRDGLISDPENFSLRINANELKVNKKKQSEELHRKYKELIESSSGQKLSNDGSFFMNSSSNN